MYKWKSLVFTYKSTSSDVISSTSGALGTVSLATDYNSLDSAYTNVREMNNSEHCNTSRPSSSFMHVIEPRYFQQKQYYVRSGPPRAGSDKRLYDPASTTLATQGMAVAGGGIGQLWVTYTVEFIKPVFDSNLETNSEICYPASPLDVTSAGNIRPFGALTIPHPYLTGNYLYDNQIGNLELGFRYDASITRSYIVFPAVLSGKSFQITWFMAGVPTAGTNGVLTVSTGTQGLGVGGGFRAVASGVNNPPLVALPYLPTKYHVTYITLGAVPSAGYFEIIYTPDVANVTSWPGSCTASHLTVTGIDTAALAAFTPL